MRDEIKPIDLTRDERVQSTSTQKKEVRVFPYILLLVVMLFFSYGYSQTMPSSSFISGTLVEIPEGASLSSIATQLKLHNIIKSPLLFSLLVTNSGKEKQILLGTYLFNTPENVFTVANRLAYGKRGIETIKVTLPEGLNIKEMSVILEKNISGFDMNDFLTLSTGQEGYLFPDTYLFLSTATSGKVYQTLRDTFDKKTAQLELESHNSNKSWSDVVIMASIIEGEAVTHDDRRIVSGILWSRMNHGMRLGVDAPFAYIMRKGSLELTQSDLATSSPYNTYRNSGLPPTPINNPGIDAIDAALYPSETSYLYYLSDKSGEMHYSKTFAEHKLNKEKYLR